MLIRFPIELLGHESGVAKWGHLVTREGEVLGTWTADENEIFGFIPNGRTEEVLSAVFIPVFIEEVEKWLADNSFESER